MLQPLPQWRKWVNPMQGIRIPFAIAATEPVAANEKVDASDVLH